MIFGGGDGTELVIAVRDPEAHKLTITCESGSRTNIDRILARTAGSTGWIDLLSNSGQEERPLVFKDKSNIILDLPKALHATQIAICNDRMLALEANSKLRIEISYSDGDTEVVRLADKEFVSMYNAHQIAVLLATLGRETPPGQHGLSVEETQVAVFEYVYRCLAGDVGIVEDGARAALTLILSLKRRRALPSYFIAEEFVIRALAFGTQAAFKRLRLNRPSDLNNELYRRINSLLALPSIVNQLGAHRLLGHGLFLVAKRAPDVELLEFARYVQSGLTELGVQSFVSYGALLGLVREGRLLDHDDDVDLLGIVDQESNVSDRAAEIENYFRANGIRVRRAATNTNGLPFLLLHRGKCHVDVFLGWSRKGMVYAPLEGVRYGSFPSDLLGAGTGLQPLGVPVTIPERSEEFLAVRYGENWRTADKMFRIREGARELPMCDENDAN